MAVKVCSLHEGNVELSLEQGLLPRWLRGKESACPCRRHGLSLGQEDPLEEGMAAHSGVLAWRIPWTEEPGGL